MLDARLKSINLNKQRIYYYLTLQHCNVTTLQRIISSIFSLTFTQQSKRFTSHSLLKLIHIFSYIFYAKIYKLRTIKQKGVYRRLVTLQCVTGADYIAEYKSRIGQFFGELRAW